MTTDVRSRLLRAFEEFGGRVSSEQILKFIKNDELLNQETRYSIKNLIASIAVVEYDSDKKRYLVLKDLVRDKENLAYNKTCQSTQTSTSQSSESKNTPKSVTVPPQGSQPTKSPELHNSPLIPHQIPTTTNSTTITSSNDTTVRSPVYSTFTNNETRLWWMAIMNCRLADMSRLLGLNPKLANWASALHYAAKFGNLNCMKLLITQYHANVNARSRGRTPLHVAVVHSQRVIIRALIEDFKADRTLMDFSGYFPYMLLEDNLRTECEPLLTHGRLQRIRTTLNIFKASNTSHDPSINTKDISNKKGVTHIDSVGEFKRPTVFPVLSRRFENFKRPVVVQQQTYLNRTSTLKPINQNGDYSTLRRPSVFEGILKTAADAAQNWNNNNTPNGKLSSSESSEEQNNGNSNFSKPPSTSASLTSSTDPHRRLVQRLDSMISLRRGQNPLSTIANDNRVVETGTFDSSSSLDNGDNFSTVNCYHRKSTTLDNYRFPLPMGHNSKNPSQPTPDPYTLKLLLSLLPSLSSTSSLSSSLKTGGDGSFDDSKSKKHHTFTSFHKHLNRKLHRSLSNSSSATSSSLTAIHTKQYRSCKRSQEFYSLPHRYHSSSTASFINGGGEESCHKSLSATALLAETDVRHLLTSKVTTVIKRKDSTVSQHSNLP
ncbi:hypothetical protein MN116_000648 [Schistosoma mekongi]|uniref:Uncharacterized protein n=1 Tax=Schistosoma mekongi TaxID=38744 RepID=A0AAE1ZKE5_SCHME|nr:hypothetical protein MN116_000648 [Schistosoma mekongi]